MIKNKDTFYVERDKKEMINSKIKHFSILYLAFFIYSFVSVFAKVASKQDTIFKMLFYMGIEICLLGMYALIWQQALKRIPLIVAMASKGITVIIALVWAVVFFGEHITARNIIGAIMIILGIGLVSADD